MSAALAVSHEPPVRKVVIHKAGGHDRLVLEESSPVAPGPGQVRIEVRAIGVNYADVTVRMGMYKSAKEFVGWPVTPGFEVAGVVTAVGPGVDLAVGARVFAVTLFGGYTSDLVVDAVYVRQMPPGMTFSQAGGFPAVYMTAWYALHELAHPRPGAVILVHSAAGGVGGALVQLGKRAGCTVVGVVGGAHKVEAAKAQGADHVIDKSSQDLWAEAARLAPGGYDVVLDANGVETLAQSYAHLRKTGKLVVYGFATMFERGRSKPNWFKLIAGWLRTPRYNPLDLTMESKSVLAFNLSYLYDRTDLLQEAMTDLERWLGEGSITPPPVTEYPLADVARAHADLESGRTTGKLVLVP